MCYTYYLEIQRNALTQAQITLALRHRICHWPQAITVLVSSTPHVMQWADAINNNCRCSPLSSILNCITHPPCLRVIIFNITYYPLILILYLYIYIYIYIYIYVYIYICIYIIFYFIFFSYKSQNILPKWEDLQSLDFILCLYAVSCIMYLFYVLWYIVTVLK